MILSGITSSPIEYVTVVSPSPLIFSLPFLVPHCGAWQLPLRTMTYLRVPLASEPNMVHLYSGLRAMTLLFAALAKLVHVLGGVYM